MKHLMPVLEGGYPLDDITIAFLQSMHNERDAFIFAAFGNLKIVEGVIFNPQTNDVSDGLIAYNGKLYHFVGGQKQAKISLHINKTQRQFEDGNFKDAFEEQFFTFGETGTDIIDFDSLKRWYNNQPLKGIELKMVAGTVTNAQLSGTGWFIADGQNGTEDLRSRFVVGFNSNDSDYNTVGKTGGSKKHQLTVDELPAHTHKAAADGGNTNSSGSNFRRESDSTGEIETKSTGSNQPHENRPPYYAVIYLQFIGID